MKKESLTKQELICMFKKQAETGILKILKFSDECGICEYYGFKFTKGFICIYEIDADYYLSSGYLNNVELSKSEYDELYDLFIEKQYLAMKKPRPQLSPKFETLASGIKRPLPMEFDCPRFAHHYIHTLKELSNYFLPTTQL
jgi:hypothetical protein